MIHITHIIIDPDRILTNSDVLFAEILMFDNAFEKKIHPNLPEFFIFLSWFENEYGCDENVQSMS